MFPHPYKLYRMNVPIILRKKRRDRSRNFDKNEKETLMSLAEKYKSVIENKKTDAVTSREKYYTWNKIAEKYNATAMTGVRTGLQLKALWESMKNFAKKEKSELNNDSAAISTSNIKVEVEDNDNTNEINKLVLEKTEDDSWSYHDVPEQISQEELTNELNSTNSSDVLKSSKRSFCQESDENINSTFQNEPSSSKRIFRDCNTSLAYSNKYLNMKKEEHFKKLKILDLIEKKEIMNVRLKQMEVEAKKLEVEMMKKELLKSSL